MTKPSQSNSTQLWTFNLAILSNMMRPLAAAVMSKLNFPSQLQFGRLSKPEYSARSGYLLFKMKLHKRTGSLTIAIYCGRQPNNESLFRQIATQSTCRYAQGERTVAAFIQTLRCDHWLESCLACFVPFKQSHIYILSLCGPGWIIIMLLFFSTL